MLAEGLLEKMKGEVMLMKLGLEVEVTPVMRLEYDWDSALTESEANPFPLAPKGLVQKGLVTRKSYQRENEALGGFVHRMMAAQQLSGHIEVLGAGLLRDLTWIPSVVESGCSVSIRDAWRVPCINAVRFLRKTNLHRTVRVSQTEVMAGWRSGRIDDERTSVYYAGQFVQNQSPEVMCEMMHHFGEYLRCQAGGRVYLLHARGEDNSQDGWGNSIPYYDFQWQQPLEDVVGSGLGIDVLGRHQYFRKQAYSLFRLTRQSA